MNEGQNVYVGIGSNLPTELFGNPLDNCRRAVQLLEQAGVTVAGRSRWYETEPIPASDQPNFVNGAIHCLTQLAPLEFLRLCGDIENQMGRERGAANAARIIDLDILAWDDRHSEEEGLIIPHPRLSERLFVLVPLQEIAADWTHPVSGAGLADMIEAIGNAQIIRQID